MSFKLTTFPTEHNSENVTKYENKALIKGKIVNKQVYPNYIVFQIYTRSGKIANFPSVFFFGENKALAESFDKGDFVEIMGKMQSYPKFNNEINRRTYSQSFVASEIRAIKENDFDVFSHTYENAIMLSGTVNYITKKSDAVTLASITVSDTARGSKLLVSGYGSMKDTLARFTPGDNISCLCSIHTSFSKKDDKLKKRAPLVVQQVRLN